MQDVTHVIYARKKRSYNTVTDNPYYHKACAALVSTDPMHEPSVARCRHLCSLCLRHIRKHGGTREQAKNFLYHMSWVSYPLRKRENDKWL